MATRTFADVTHRTGRFLDNHPLVRWFVVPLLFMATVVLLVGVFLGFTNYDLVQLVSGYLLVSTLAVLLGLAVERVLVAILSR